MTTGNVLGLAVLALSCADQADGATPVAPSITVPDQAPAEAQPSRRPANDTAHTVTSGPAARTTETRACRCGPRTRPTLWTPVAARRLTAHASTGQNPGPAPRRTAPPDRGTVPG
ncbi:hypothetical protein ACFYNM_22010 [Streptomyces spororaveus]|uniref:hypothetical protein n=1 Tax=Streptomyces spororaveus TaxID=284039 RepID=UPI0036C22D0E